MRAARLPVSTGGGGCAGREEKEQEALSRMRSWGRRHDEGEGDAATRERGQQLRARGACLGPAVVSSGWLEDAFLMVCWGHAQPTGMVDGRTVGWFPSFVVLAFLVPPHPTFSLTWSGFPTYSSPCLLLLIHSSSVHPLLSGVI